MAPSFNHAMKDPVEGAIEIAPEIRIVIIKGNWLIFECDSWRQIPSYMDDTWFVNVDADLARRRVAARHLKSGIEDNWEAALKRADRNDLLNGEEVRRFLIKPNFTIRSIEV